MSDNTELIERLEDRAKPRHRAEGGFVPNAQLLIEAAQALKDSDAALIEAEKENERLTTLVLNVAAKAEARLREVEQKLVQLRNAISLIANRNEQPFGVVVAHNSINDVAEAGWKDHAALIRKCLATFSFMNATPLISDTPSDQEEK